MAEIVSAATAEREAPADTATAEPEAPAEGSPAAGADAASVETAMAQLKVAEKITVLYGGELAQDIAERIVKDSPTHSLKMECGSMEGFKKLKLDQSENTVVFVVQTIENNATPEAAGGCVRFFKRKTHATDLLSGKLQFTVLCVGDSNLLLDRQTTTAKDCNAAGQALDSRLKELPRRVEDLRPRRGRRTHGAQGGRAVDRGPVGGAQGSGGCRVDRQDQY